MEPVVLDRVHPGKKERQGGAGEGEEGIEPYGEETGQALMAIVSGTSDRAGSRRGLFFVGKLYSSVDLASFQGAWYMAICCTVCALWGRGVLHYPNSEAIGRQGGEGGGITSGRAPQCSSRARSASANPRT